MELDLDVLDLAMQTVQRAKLDASQDNTVAANKRLRDQFKDLTDEEKYHVKRESDGRTLEQTCS